MDLLKQIGKHILDIVDIQKIAWEVWSVDLVPYLELKVQSSESKWDDVLLDAAKKLAESFLKPDA